jgi:hypothetical protein
VPFSEGQRAAGADRRGVVLRIRSGADLSAKMMYSPNPMEDRGETPDLEVLEGKLGELERLTDSLGSVPDEELVEKLNEAVRLLGEINARIEAGIAAAGDESSDIGALLDDLDLGPFDEALDELERRERSTGEP